MNDVMVELTNTTVRFYAKKSVPSTSIPVAEIQGREKLISQTSEDIKFLTDEFAMKIEDEHVLLFPIFFFRYTKIPISNSVNVYIHIHLFGRKIYENS